MSHLFSLVAVLLYTLLPQPSSGDGVSLGEPILRDKFINPRDQILDRGAKANLTCRPLDNDFQFQFWSFILNGSGQLYEVISDLAQFGYSLEPTNRNGRLTTNLIIDSVEDRHETYYQCVMKNGSESLYYSDGAQVIIFEQADVKFHKDTPISDKVFTAQAGSPATLSIEVSGKPTPMLTLQKQAGSTWTTVTDERFIVNASQIYVSYVKMGDSGKYQLIVNNTVDRRISLLFEIRVEGGVDTPQSPPIMSTDPTPTPTPDTLVIGVGAGVGALVLFILVGGVLIIVIVCVVRLRRAKSSFSPEIDAVEKGPPPPYISTQMSSCSEVSLKGSPYSRPRGTQQRNRYGYDPSWEVQPEQLQLKNILYENQIVIVYKGSVHVDNEKKVDSVAVKTIKEGGSENDFEDLMQEMMLMSKLPNHENVLELMGIVNQGVKKMILTPCMSHGDLVGFLRSTRSIPGMFAVQPASEGNNLGPAITSQDLLKIALQISRGMEFLHDHQVVHKALCGRNVLVGSNMVVKVCNYGMMKPEKYHHPKYYKWVAPETFVDRVFDKKSDVWAFGVVLWELVTLGGCPYVNMDMKSVIHQLNSGIRLSHPSHVAQEIYSLMLRCWDKETCTRPPFADISKELNQLWEVRRVYVDLPRYDADKYSTFDDHQSISTC